MLELAHTFHHVPAHLLCNSRTQRRHYSIAPNTFAGISETELLCPGTCYIDQAGTQETHLPTSASGVLTLNVPPPHLALSVNLKYFKGLILFILNYIYGGEGYGRIPKCRCLGDLALQVVVRHQIAMKGIQGAKLLVSSRAVHTLND